MTSPLPGTLAARLARTVAQHPDSPAVVDRSEVGGGASVTYAELSRRARSTAAYLRSLGVRRGDSVAVLLPNCLPWIDLHLATARLGALLVPLNTRYRATELSHLLRLSGARVLLTAAEFEGVDFASRLADLETDVPVEHVLHVGPADGLPSRWTRHDVGTVLTAEPLAEDDVDARPDDPVIVFGTSGTTSSPKLAVHTNRTILAHLPHVAERLGFGPDVRQLTVLSLSGTFGWVPFEAALSCGSPVVLLPIFKLPRVLLALREEPCDVLVAAEGSLRELLGLPHGRVPDAEALRPLRFTVTAGLSIADIADRSAEHGIVAMNVYGSSEVFAFAATSAPDAALTERLRPGGRVVATGTRARVVDPDGGELPVGEVGELQFQGPSVFPHYLHNATATTGAFTADGWFRTGDSARMVDTSTFEYLARANDTLRLGGYSVNPADVETTIEAMAGVHRAQVVGVRDERTGDDIGVAFVQPAPGAGPVDELAVETWCRRELASFKVPRRVVIVEEYPTTPSANGDKVRRDVLRTMATEALRSLEEVAG